MQFELKRHARYPSTLAIGYIDVDHFKSVNSRYLLTGGDEVLKGLARILSNAIREVDSVGRVGGEEFVLLARETTLEGAAVLAERVRSLVEATPIVYNGHNIHITVSVGFIVAESGTVGSEELFKQAARASDDARRNGRNRSVVRSYQPSETPVALVSDD